MVSENKGRLLLLLIIILIFLTLKRCEAAIDTVYISIDTVEWDSGTIKQYEQKTTVQHLARARSYSISTSYHKELSLYLHSCDSNCTVAALSIADGRLCIVGDMWRGDSLLMTEWPGSFSSMLYEEYYVVIDHGKTALSPRQEVKIFRQPIGQGYGFDLLGRVQRTTRFGISIINHKPQIEMRKYGSGTH